MEIILFEMNKIIMDDKVFLSKTLIESLIKLQQLYAMGRFAVSRHNVCELQWVCELKGVRELEVQGGRATRSGSMRLTLRKV